jgi:hypothetical protein
MYQLDIMDSRKSEAARAGEGSTGWRQFAI